MQPSDRRRYRYGTTPEALIALRLIFGDRVMFDTTTRQYYVSNLGASEPGSDSITRLDAGIMVRIYGHHALGFEYVYSHHLAQYPGLSARSQSVVTLGLSYNLIGDQHFGAVEWR